jgi:hypothetical protein
VQEKFGAQIGDSASHKKEEKARESNGDAPHHKPKKVMVFCDGMWSCGQLTGTRTNVKLVADAIAARQSSQLQGAFFVSCRDP